MWVRLERKANGQIVSLHPLQAKLGVRFKLVNARCNRQTLNVA